ncbi:MAG: translation initiation factor IF-2 subunit beta [Nanoarchaeota archaeon]|nr:translation initiation factor IF-2 subunit beta [Nanoarchaeota archaeon]
MGEYEDLLNEAYENIKPISDDYNRWEVPSIELQNSGTKTVINNFVQIASYLRRKPEHLIKFLSRELAAYCKLGKNRLMLNRRLSKEKIEGKLKIYINKYVICPECKKPDTEIVKQDGLMFLHCLACGAKHSLGRS